MATAGATQPSPLERIAGWADADPDLSLDEQGRLIVAGEPPLLIEVTAEDETVLLIHRVAGRVAAPSLSRRGGTIRSELAGDVLMLSTTVYVEGLDRQSFAIALRSLVGVVDEIGSRRQETVGATDPPPRSVVEEPAPTREMPAVWTPTHAVPAGGVRAWSEPDPMLDPIATLEARVRLSIAEQRGEWTRVVGSNGWTGWVDARTLEPLPAEPQSSSVDAFARRRVRTLVAVGAVAIALSVVLPWVRPVGNTFNAFDISARFLFDYSSVGVPDLGWAILGVALVALLLAVIDAPAPIAVLAGLVSIAIAGLFAIQLYRGVTDTGGAWGDMMDLIGFAPLVTVGGGVLVAVGARK